MMPVTNIACGLAAASSRLAPPAMAVTSSCLPAAAAMVLRATAMKSAAATPLPETSHTATKSLPLGWRSMLMKSPPSSRAGVMREQSVRLPADSEPCGTRACWTVLASPISEAMRCWVWVSFALASRSQRVLSATRAVISSCRASTRSVIRPKLRARLPISSLRSCSGVVSSRGGRSPSCRRRAASAIASTGRVSQRRALQVVTAASRAIRAAAPASPVAVSRRMRPTTSSARFSMTMATARPLSGSPMGAALSRMAALPLSSSMLEVAVAAERLAARVAIATREASQRLHAPVAAVPSRPGPGAAAARRTAPGPPSANAAVSAIQTPVTPSTSARRFASVCQALSTSVPSPVRVATSTLVVSRRLALVAAARVTHRRRLS